MLKHLYRFYDRIFELMNWTYYWISIMLKINRQYFFRKWNKVDIFFSIIIRLLYWRVFTDDLLMEIRHFMKTLRKQKVKAFFLTLSWRGPLSYRNQSIDLQSKSIDLSLYDNSLRHERVKGTLPMVFSKIILISSRFIFLSVTTSNNSINVCKTFRASFSTIVNIFLYTKSQIHVISGRILEENIWQCIWLKNL